MKKEKVRLGAALKERFRKAMVSLKRKPHMIPLTVLLVAFLWYTLQLTVVSNATVSINTGGMGLSGFVTLLFSILGLVCFGYSFPHRKPVVAWKLGLMFLLFGCVIYADVHYMNVVRDRVYQEFAYSSADKIINNLSVIDSRQVVRMQTKHAISNLLSVHILLVSIGLALTALLPVYTPLIRRIRTSVHVDSNENMGKIDIDGDD